MRVYNAMMNLLRWLVTATMVACHHLSPVATAPVATAAAASGTPPPPNPLRSKTALPLTPGVLTLDVSTSELRLAGEPQLVTKLDASVATRGMSEAATTELTRSLASTGQRELALAIDADVPYRIVGDVLFACARARIGRFHFVVAREGGPGEIVVDLSGPDRVLLIGLDEGIVIKARSGNIAPGCKEIGSGITVPNANGKVDADALESCLKLVSAALPDASGVTFMPTWDAPFAQLVTVFDAERIAGFKSLALSNRPR